MSEPFTEDQWMEWSAALAERAQTDAPAGAHMLHTVSALTNAAMMILHMMDLEGAFGEGGGVKKVKEMQKLLLEQYKALDTYEIELIGVPEGSAMQ